jgi:hypothetical protein
MSALLCQHNLCAAGAVFIPNIVVDSVTQQLRKSTAGRWIEETIDMKRCNSLQSCWDMCYLCDGTPKFNPDVSLVPHSRH